MALGSDLTNDFLGDKWIVPLRWGYVLDVAGKQWLIGGAALVAMTWLVIDNPAVTGHTARMTYNGVEVLASRVAWMATASARGRCHAIGPTRQGLGVLGTEARFAVR